MKGRVIIFDLDGTAINSPTQKVPSARLVQAIQSLEDKYYLCAATGRVWSFSKPVLRDLTLGDPCVISGGTQICQPQSGEIIWQCNIAQDDLRKVLEIVTQYLIIKYFITTTLTTITYMVALIHFCST
jgi:hydroxymethylpyrimidine pyrophosphatase-like HAD family hydrolase